jgi:hypothetical protein
MVLYFCYTMSHQRQLRVSGLEPTSVVPWLKACDQKSTTLTTRSHAPMVGVDTANVNKNVNVVLTFDFPQDWSSRRIFMKIPSHFEQRFLDFLGHCVNFSLSVLCGNDFHLMLSNVYTQISTMYCTVDVLNQVFRQYIVQCWWTNDDNVVGI